VGDWSTIPTSEHSGAFLRLQTLLTRLNGFHALILQHNNPAYRDGLIHKLGLQPPQILDLTPLASYEAIEQQYVTMTGAGMPLHLINLENLSKIRQQAFFQGINYHREYLARQGPSLLLLWLAEPQIRELALEAPDFWAWREQVLDFSLPLKIQTRVSANIAVSYGLELEKKQQRIAEIQQYLAGQTENPVSISHADLEYELGNLYQALGDYALAEDYLQQALGHFSMLDEKHAYARVLMGLATLQFQQGKPDAALAALQDKVLPWFERLGDRLHQAEAKGKIADILQARGQLDEALRIRTQDQLPVYERLGEVRSIAITKGQIADIRFRQGAQQDAIAIYETEVLPACQTLGDKRMLLVDQANLALMYRQAGTHPERTRSLLCEALQAARQMQIPEAQQIEAILQQLGLACLDS